MANPEHIEIVKQGAEATRKWREQHPHTRLDLERADLRGADLVGVDLRGANLVKANLNEAKMGGAWLVAADLGGAEMYGADLVGAKLPYAKLSGADMSKANLAKADLRDANLAKADLREAELGGADLTDVRGAYQARGLETVRLTLSDSTHAARHTDDVRYFETSHRPWLERWLDWELLRVVGRLPLFGISYTALILIPVVFYGLAFYNDKVELIRTWAEQIAALPDHPLHRFAPLVLERLRPRPIPSLSFVLLVSTVLLATGSTLYTFFCPSRVKEFSRDQWCDQLGRSLLHYWPLAWKHRNIRLACAACYVLGGAGALWVLGTKVWHTGMFILKQSTVSWPWR